MSIARNTSLNLAGLVLPVVLSLATVPAYLALVGLERYGALAIAWLFLGYFGAFDLGLGRAVTQRVAELYDGSREERAAVFYTALFANIPIGIIGGLLLAISADYFFASAIKVDANLRDELSDAAVVLGLALPVATLVGVLLGALQGREQFAKANAASIASTVLFQLVPLFVAWQFTTNASILLLAGLATRIASAVILLAMCRAEFGPPRGLRPDFRQAGQLLKFGGWVTVTTFSAPFLTLIDRFAIGTVLGAAAVSIYTVPYQVVQRMVIIPTAATNALFPRLSALTDLATRSRLVRDTSDTLVSLTTLPAVVAILIAEAGLGLWLGDDFASKAAATTRVLIAGTWINALALVPFTRLQAERRPHVVAGILAFEVPLYIAALYLGLTHFGLVGCAFAMLFRSALDYLLLSIFAGEWRIWSKVMFVNTGLVAAALVIADIARGPPLQSMAAGTALCLITIAFAWSFLPDNAKNSLLTSRLASRFHRD